MIKKKEYLDLQHGDLVSHRGVIYTVRLDTSITFKYGREVIQLMDPNKPHWWLEVHRHKCELVYKKG